MTEIVEKFRDLLLDIHDEWKKSEACVKEAEQVNGTVIFPAVKELRYAGRRLVDALYLICTAPDDRRIFDYLMDAKFDANRARHDAVDAIVSKIAIDTENIMKSYDYETIEKTLPDIQEYIEIIIAVQEIIVNSRGSVENRNEIYDGIERDYFKKMLEIYRKMEKNEMNLKKIALVQKEKEKLRARWAYGFGFFGLILGALGVISFLTH